MRSMRRQLLVSILLLVSVLYMLSGCRRAVVPPDPKTMLLPGSSMQFLYVSGASNFMLVDFDPGRKHAASAVPLHQATGSYISAVWAPDGDAIAWSQQTMRDALDIWIYDCSSQQVRPLVTKHITDGYVDLLWLPDGEHLVLDYPGLITVFQLGEPLPMAKIGYLWYFSPAWAPDGTKVAYSHPRAIDPPLPVGDGYSADVVVYCLVTHEASTAVEGDADYMYYPVVWPSHDQLIIGRLNPANADDRAFYSWSPDGPVTAMEAASQPDPRGSRQFVESILPPALRRRFVETGQFAWAADLTWVVVNIQKEPGVAEIWAVSADGSTAHLIDSDAMPGQRPQWRPGRDRRNQ